MNLKEKIKIFILFVTLFSIMNSVNGQKRIFDDPYMLLRIEEGVDFIYNFQFDESDSVLNELKNRYPDHPVTPLFNALQLYWKYFPVTPISDYHQLYTELITESIQRSEKMLESNEEETEAIFLNLMGRLLIMQYYADNRQSSEVIPFIRRGYKMAVKGFELTDEFSDFKFSTGIYNYYREAYPEAHPVYKPIAFFFPEGDLERGQKQLIENGEHGLFLKAESIFFLAYLSVYFEKDYRKGLRFSRRLNREYPHNPLYLAYRIHCKMLLEKHSTALPMIQQLRSIPHETDYFLDLGNFYLGIIEEKMFKHPDLAKKVYMKTIKEAKKYGGFGNNLQSYAYFGLSRIYQKEDKSVSNKLRIKGEDLAAYDHITFDD